MFQVAYFDTSLHIGPDAAHTIGGCIADVVLKCMESRRYTPTVHTCEQYLQRFDTDVQPWCISHTDKAAAVTALGGIVATTISRMTGSRFAKLFAPGKKNKLHNSFVLASPYGRSLAGEGQVGAETFADGTAVQQHKAALQQHNTAVVLHWQVARRKVMQHMTLHLGVGSGQEVFHANSMV